MDDGRSSTGKKQALRPRGSAFLAAGGVAMMLLAGACGGESSGKVVAGATTDAASSAPAASSKADPIKYSKCMREHGVTGFPDLDANGNSVGTPGPNKIDGKSPAFKAAEKACAAFKPKPRSQPNPEKFRKNQIKYSKCMRDNGISNFPDPNAKGDLELNPPETGIDPESEQFKKASEKCRPLLVVPPGARAPRN